MVEVIQQTEPTARKEHECHACRWIIERDGRRPDLGSFSNYRKWIEARDNGFKILPGQKYIRQTNKYEGVIYTWKAIPAIHQICCDLNLYEL